MKITVRKIRQWFAIGHLEQGEWRICRDLESKMQMVYTTREKARKVAHWVRDNYLQTQ